MGKEIKVSVKPKTTKLLIEVVKDKQKTKNLKKFVKELDKKVKKEYENKDK